MDYKDAFKKRANVNEPRCVQDNDHNVRCPRIPHYFNGKFTSYSLVSNLLWLSNLLHFWGFPPLLCHLPFWFHVYYFLPEN